MDKLRDPVPSFTLPRIAELSGVDARTLHNWLNRGLLVPTIEKANGSGTTNLFATNDAFQALVLGDLRRHGLELRALELAAEQLRSLGEEAMMRAYLVLTDELHAVDDPRDFAGFVEQGGAILIYSTNAPRKVLAQASGEG